MSKLSLPHKNPPAIPSVHTPESLDITSIRKDLILALIPVASRHALSNPQQVVEIATKLCDYVVTGRKPLDSPPEQGGPA